LATSKAIRADDVSGLNIATVSATEDAVTKDFQRVVLNDPTTVGNMAGVDGSGNLKVTGTVTANAGSGTQAVRPSDGTNAVTKTFDLDSGAGTEWNLGVGLRKAASGGSVEAGTASDPLRVDPTGTTFSRSVERLPRISVLQGRLPLMQRLPVVRRSRSWLTPAEQTLPQSQPQAHSKLTIQQLRSPFPALSPPTSEPAARSRWMPALPDYKLLRQARPADRKATLAQGAVTTNAPTYTTAQTDPLSLDTSGNLRVSLKDTPQNTNALKVDGSAVTQPVSGTVTANQGGTWTVQPGNTANTTAWKVDGSAVTQPVSGTFWQATQPVQSVGNGTLLSNQQAVTASAVALASNACRKVVVKALVANSIKRLCRANRRDDCHGL
jgi:hypothetical protein